MRSNGKYILGIDPGRAKCGLALVYHSARGCQKLYGKVIAVSQLEEELRQLLAQWPLEKVVLGDGTGKKAIFQRLNNFFSSKIEINYVDERNSSLEARRRYWQEKPARGIWRLIPTSMRVPPEPYDEYVALILIERYLEARKKCEEEP